MLEALSLTYDLNAIRLCLVGIGDSSLCTYLSKILFVVFLLVNVAQILAAGFITWTL